MNEIEVKVFNVDIESIKTKVISLGGSLVKKENQENYYYDFPPHMADEKGYIRIRKITNLLDDTKKSMLCIKKIISQDIVRKTIENEFEISDFNSADGFLKTMGINFIGCQNKYRESYKILDTLVEIDIWDKNVFPYPYIEIEGKDEKSIKDILSLLEIPFDKSTSKSLEQIKKEFNLPARVKE